MTGLESLVLIGKIITPLIVLGLSTAIKFLWDIKTSSKRTENEFNSFKEEFREELINVKHQLERVSDKIKDSFSKSETSNLLLQLENKLQNKIYDLFNTYQQKIGNKKPLDIG